MQQNQYKEGIIFASGCGYKKCPCRAWVSCHKYNNIVWKNIHQYQVNEELHEWYDTRFRISYEYCDSFGNG
jgi:hypothetical protein